MERVVPENHSVIALFGAFECFSTRRGDKHTTNEGITSVSEYTKMTTESILLNIIFVS